MNFVREGTDDIAPEVSQADRRPLYDRLKEQKDKKQLEWDETHQLKNQFRGIDEDEAIFLHQVGRIRNNEEIEKKKEESELVKLSQNYDRPMSSAESTSIKIKSTSGPMTKSTACKKSTDLLSRLVRKRKISESTKDVEEDTECIKKNMVRSKTVTGINSIAESEKRADKNNELKLERTSIQGIVNYDSSESSDVE